MTPDTTTALLTQVLAGLAALMSMLSVVVCSRIKAAVAELKAEIFQLLLGYVTHQECDRLMEASGKKHAARP